MDIDYEINKYLNDYFKDLNKLIKFHESKIIENKLDMDSPIDYVKLYPFINNTISTLAKNDKGITLGVFRTLHSETTELIKLYQQFVKEHNGKVKQHNQKMLSYFEIHHIIPEEDLKSESVLNVIFATFKKSFEIMYKNTHIRFRKIVQVKSYYTDKLFWSNARKSPIIKDFFERLGLTGKLNLKLYLAYYIKRVKTTSIKDPAWQEFLIQTFKML
jgi:hypothetical protein